MPVFKTTYNILKKCDEDELYTENIYDSDKLVLPPMYKWSYDKELSIEDVDVWEVIYEESGGVGIYASWCPYAEFYLITTGLDFRNQPRIIKEIQYFDRQWETYYGAGALDSVIKRSKELNLNIAIHNDYWVDDDQMWLYK
jgi:hypothetical protein